MRSAQFDGRQLIIHDLSDAEIEQAKVLIEALGIYSERNEKYHDNWRRFGWRGCLFRIRERAERLWDDFWDKEPHPDLDEVDDALDAINMLGFFVRAVRESNRDGAWW